MKSAEVRFVSQEFPHHEKNHLWYFGIGLLALVGLYFSYQANDPVLTVLVIVLAVALIKVSRLKPEKHETKINKRGLSWGKNFFPYHKIKYFYLDDPGNGPHLYFDLLGWRPNLSVAVPESSVEAAVEILAQHLPFHEHRREPLSDRLNRLFKI